MASEKIDVWRCDELDGVEFRSGTAVSEPYPRHWHDEYQFCFIEDGGGELVYRGSFYPTPKISLFVVHPGEVHSNSTETGCSFRSIYVSPSALKNITRDSDGSDRELPFFSNPMIFDRELISYYVGFHRISESPSDHLERESAMLGLIERLINRYADRTVKYGSFGRERVAVKLVREYITENSEQNLSLETLAGLAGLSPFHLNRVFSSEIGMPPHAFQTQVRISKAKRLIRKGRPLSDVAAATGFADQSHFHRHFKRLMKITPGDY